MKTSSSHKIFKTGFVLLALCIITATHAQAIGWSKNKIHYRTEIDTISIRNDSLLANIRTYHNDTLDVEGIAFILKDSIRMPRFRLLGNIFMKTVPVGRIIRHGTSVVYREDGKRKVTVYSFGKPVTISYFDEHDQEISQTEFKGDRLFEWRCQTVAEEVLIYGR